MAIKHRGNLIGLLVVEKGKRKPIYRIINVTKKYVIVSTEDQEEKIFETQQLDFYFPLEIGKRYIFTANPKNPSKIGNYIISGAYTVTAIEDDKFGLNGMNHECELANFMDITPLRSKSVYTRWATGREIIQAINKYQENLESKKITPKKKS